MSNSSPKSPSRGTQNALLGDLESIRSLLETDAGRSARRVPDPPEEDIPTLDDIVDDAPAVYEPAPAGVEVVEPVPAIVSAPSVGMAPAIGSAPAGGLVPPIGLADDAFDALLGDKWRDAAERILDDARSQLESRAAEWATDDSTDFSEALKARLNDVVRGWLADVVRSQLEDLRETLMAAIEIEIDAHSARLKESRDDAE